MKNILYDTENATLDISTLSPENQKLGEGLMFMAQCVTESLAYATALANGELGEVPPRQNPLAGPLKDLDANLRHLSWQASQVANGDYSQKVEYLGDFSTSFNTMIEQLRLKEELREEQNKQQAHYYEQVTAKNNELRAYRHDMKNHALIILSLLSYKKYDEAQAYIEKLSSATNKKDAFISTDNHIFDALVSDKIQLAQKEGIKINTKIGLKPNMKIDNIDWVALFGNALDNAIEACRKLEHTEKVINLAAVTKGNMMQVLVENPIETELTPNKHGLFDTSKTENRENHGLGLKNMARIAAKYNGTFNVEAKDGKFTLSMLLLDVI